VLGAEAVERVLQHAAECGPTSLQLHNGGLLRDQLLSLVPVDAPLPPQTSTASTRVYLAGQVQLRARDRIAAALLTSATGCAQLNSCLQATFEQVLFAPLFPHDRGFYAGLGTLPDYVRLRFMALLPWCVAGCAGSPSLG
jgi:hypothetical protein